MDRVSKCAYEKTTQDVGEQSFELAGPEHNA